jgi:galactonate dehydratase
MILYVRVIQLAAQKGSPEEVSKYLQTGEQAQRDLATCGPRSSFVQRYIVVLEELRQEARTAVNQDGHHQVPNAIRDNTLSYGQETDIGVSTYHTGVQPDELESVNGPLHINKGIVENRSVEDPGGLQGSNLMIAPSMQSNPPQWPEGGVGDNLTVTGFTGLTDWGHLDSLAVAGMGELDILFSHGWELSDSREAPGDR